jgi:hypothetical protein
MGGEKSENGGTSAGLSNLYSRKDLKPFMEDAVNPTYDQTHIKLNSRTLIIGGSGTGKTHYLTHFLGLSPKTFEHVVICNRGIEEPLYEYMRKQLEPKGQITFFTLETMPDVEKLHAMRKHKKDEYLVIFDDIITDLNLSKKYRELLKTYFIVGRKRHMTIMFLSQSYYEIPKMIRLNITYLVLLKIGNDRDLQMVLRDNSLGITMQQLLIIHRQATERPFNSLKIEVESPELDTRFERNFTDSFIITEHEKPDGTIEREVRPGDWYKPIRGVEEQYQPRKRGRPRKIQEESSKKRKIQILQSDSDSD